MFIMVEFQNLTFKLLYSNIIFTLLLFLTFMCSHQKQKIFYETALEQLVFGKFCGMLVLQYQDISNHNADKHFIEPSCACNQ